MSLFVGMWSVWFGASALAYETDQLTDRELQLADSTAVANRLIAPMFAAAVANTNAKTACRASDDETRRVLARHLHRLTSEKRTVPTRGLLRAPGFSIFSAALEESEADRFGFADRSDIYGGVKVWQSVILRYAGPCSTFEIAGVRIGSDKLDHFLDVGFSYFEHSSHDVPLDRVLARGTGTERLIYGLLTSKTFSWADLEANWDGYRFYRSLLREGSALQRDEAGCVVQERPFNWSEWVGPGWDEVLQPSSYTRLVDARVLRHLEHNRDALCAARQIWDAGGHRDAQVAALPRDPEFVRGPTPDRDDPYQLAALCDPAREAPLEPPEERNREVFREARAEARRQRR